MAHRYSLAFLTVFDLGPVEAVRAAGAAGYDLIGLRMLPAAPGTEAAYPLLTDDRVLAESFGRLARLAAGFGLTVDLEFMPWTRVPDLSTALRIVEAAGEANGGVLVDALHYDRSATTLAEVAAMPRSRVNYVQFCDGPRDYDRSDAGLIEVARRARLMPGEGGIDLAGLARAIPGDAVISVEIPNHALAARMDGAERAALALRATKAVVEGATVG